MRPNRRTALPLLLLAVALASCGGTAEPLPSGTGHVSVYLTDAPSYAFDNVWVTVRAVWFHKVVDAAFSATASGWVRFNAPGGVTVNLAALSGDNNVVKIFDNLALPAGTYRQMLLFLEPTESALTQSAFDNGLIFNNQVDKGALHAALRVPNASQGIRIADRAIQVENGAVRNIAIDFDVGRDVLPFNRGTVQEFLFQPRPRSFDLDNAGAIVGHIDNTAAADKAALFEVLAEQVADVAGFNAHVVRRTAAVDNATGRFVLYPLVPGSIGNERYDIVIRGIGWRTAIVKFVPVMSGTAPASGATRLGTQASPIPMATGSDFRIAAAITGTSGALAKLYQVLGADAPYVIRQANFDPLTGRMTDFPLSMNQVGVDTFDPGRYNGGTITLTPTSPTDGDGNYRLLAEAPLFDPSAPPAGGVLVNPSLAFDTFLVTGLSPTDPASSNAITTPLPGGITVPQPVAPLDNLVVFATHGGTIVNARGLGQVSATGATIPYSITTLPGGQPGASFPLAVYVVSAYGWRTSGADNILRIADPVGTADLRIGDAAVNLMVTAP